MRNYFFRIKFLLLFSLLLFAGSGIHAQVYPVQVTVVPTPPHRNYLNSFSEQGALNVFLTLTDFNSGPISVKLKMELNGPGYQFRSLPNNLVYVLNPGQPVQVPMEDLAVFFSSTGQSLNFNPAKLPEGNTSICVDVVKNQSGEVLSQNGCGYFYMGYGQPASLLQPTCNSTIQVPAGYPASTDLGTLPLQFNFIPALAPIGLQQEVENTLYIYNWLGTVNNNPPLTPVGLALAMDPVELGPITSHTLLPINNQLIVGQEYVWYVKTSLNGSTNQFQNGGWSAPCKFKYGSAQSVEEVLANGLSVEWVDLVSNSESKGTGSWKVVKEDPNSSATFNQFILKYRRKVPAGQEPFEWFSDTVNDLSKAIYQLEPATTYEASVAGRLGSFVSQPTEIRTFTTAPPRTYSCGVANFPGKATAFQPLEYADPGMKVKIGMFQLEFVSVQNTGQPGHFSGTGLIPVDFLFGAEARVKFDDLKIDKEYDVWEGTASVITDGLDAWLEDQYQQFQDPIFVNGTVDSAYVSDSIAHVVIDGVDTTFTFPCATCPVIINDVAGNQITIYPNGTVIWNSYLDVSDEQLNVPDSEIGVFEQHAQETGGFDPFEHIEWNTNYEIIRTSNAVNYFVANKSLKKGQTDKVSLSVPENKYTAANVKLSWAGLTTPLAPVSNTVSSGKRVFVFDLPAFNDEDEFEIYAVSDNLKIGKLNVVVYEVETKNVVIVPLAGTVDATQLTAQLNETLGEAGLNFTVEIGDTLGVGKYIANSALNIPDATLMSKYSGKMRQIRNSYFDKHDSENDTYYLFVVSSLMDTVNNQSVDGYMVRGKSIGFIHAGSSLHTFAHELGHGIGALEHSWKNNGPEQGGTNNLMDYGNGVNLILSQWKELRDPKGQGFWDEEDSFEAVSNSLKGKNVFYFWEYEADNSIKDNLMGYYYLSDPNNYNSRKIIYATQWLKIKDITGYDYPQSCNTLFGAKEAFKIATKNSGNCVGCPCYSDEVIFETRSPQSQTSIIVKNNGSLSYLEGETHSGAIVYMNVYGENILTGKRKYSHTSNQIYLEKYKYKTDMTEHHYVLSLRDGDDKIIEQKVFRLVDSKDVTQELISGDSYVSTVNKNVFYFWKEDNDGYIVDNVIMKPLSTQKRLAYMDLELSSHYTSINKIKDDIVYNAGLESSYMMVDLPYPQSHEEMSTVVFEKGGKVHRIPAAESHNKVLYFNVINNKYKYEYASNKLDLKYWNYNGDVFTHFYVLTYWGLDQSGNSVITNQKVFSYANGDVTEQYKKYKSLSGPLIHTVFVNGYRPNQGWDPIWNAGGLEKAESNNKITTQDFTSYWNENEIGSKFIERLKPIHVYYADGHFSAETSNHYGPLNAYGNMQVFENHIGTICDKSVEPSKHHCSTYTESVSGPGGGAAITIVFKDELATQSNVAGFQQRYNAGKIAGQNLIKELKKKITQAEKNQEKIEHNFSQDTIDFVAHSMGFAYSLGMIDELKGKINFGNYLILAPENAGAAQGSAALTNYFQTIWHYGSNLGMAGEDPICMQDGVAPQTNIPGLSNNRVAIPNTEDHNKKKGYGESHYHGFFGWIFTEITTGTKGYIKQRK